MVVPEASESILVEISVKEVVQAGDVFLLRFPCAKCATEVFTSFPCTTCPECLADLAECSFRVSKTRAGQRLVVGTRRKKQIGKKIIRMLLEIQEGLCAYCGAAFGAYETDHILPLSVGGTNDADNLCLCCPECNRFAGSRVFADFNGKRKFILSRRKERSK